MREEAEALRVKEDATAGKQRPSWEGRAQPPLTARAPGFGPRETELAFLTFRTAREPACVVSSLHVGAICYRSHWS